MKNYFSKGLILIFTLLSHHVCAQTNSQEAVYKNGEIALEKFLNKKFHEEYLKNHFDICLISVTFAKFTIDTAGNVKDLSISENRDTPPVFKNILTSVIQSTNGNWLPKKVNNKPVESKPFILPLIYELEAACKAPAPDGTSNSLTSFLDFKDADGKKVSQLDCILLQPLHMFSAK